MNTLEDAFNNIGNDEDYFYQRFNLKCEIKNLIINK